MTGIITYTAWPRRLLSIGAYSISDAPPWGLMRWRVRPSWELPSGLWLRFSRFTSLVFWKLKGNTAGKRRWKYKLYSKGSKVDKITLICTVHNAPQQADLCMLKFVIIIWWQFLVFMTTGLSCKYRRRGWVRWECTVLWSVESANILWHLK